jgi:hypothetical protein
MSVSSYSATAAIFRQLSALKPLLASSKQRFKFSEARQFIDNTLSLAEVAVITATNREHSFFVPA